MATFESYDAVLRTVGYVPAEPAPGAAAIDAAAAALGRCAGCRRTGLEYRPYHRAGSYRALAVCPTCGEAFEF